MIKGRAFLILITAIIVLGSIWFFTPPRKTYSYFRGVTMGVIAYNIKFEGQCEGCREKISLLLDDFNQSLSNYIEDSEISTLNRLGTLVYKSPYLYPILHLSKKIYEDTQGAFDPTIGLLVRKMGFGPDKDTPLLSEAQIDHLLQYVGYDALIFDKHHVSMPLGYELNFSAIAKGYAVDIVSEFMEQHNVVNYMVEIGGEVRARGVNQENKAWVLGIQDPMRETEMLAQVGLSDRALATSGNYRNFYKKDGKTVAHIINPRNGKMMETSLLSVSVFAEDCMTADAYATAFMVLGLDESKKSLAQHPLMDAFIVYQGDEGSIEYYMTSGLDSTIHLVR